MFYCPLFNRPQPPYIKFLDLQIPAEKVSVGYYLLIIIVTNYLF